MLFQRLVNTTGKMKAETIRRDGMEKVLKDLCVEIASGDIGTERFNRLWIESGIPLEGFEFEIANLILVKAQDTLPEEVKYERTMH